MNKNIKVFTATSLVSVLAFTGISPGFASASSSKETTKEVYVQENDFGYSITAPTELDRIIKEENLSVDELIKYGNYVKAETSSEFSIQWKGAVVKKAVKYMVDHSNIIPSKKLRNAVDKYGKNIIKGIDTAETYTWYGIATALSKAGVPDKWADAIADFIVKFLL